jgi:carboxylesterase
MQNISTQVFSRPEHQPFDLPGERGAALLVHGFGGTPAEMRPLGERLNAQGWAARGVLLPGFGVDFASLGSVGRREWVERLRGELRDLQRQHERVALIGFSMGGALGVNIAIETPPAALVLINPFTKIDNFVWRMLPILKYAVRDFKPFQVVKLDFESEEARRNIGQFMPDADLSDPEVQAAVRSFSLPTRTLDELRAVGAAAYARAARVRTPTLVIQATRDTTASPTYSRRLAARIPGARWVEIDGEHNFIQHDADRLRETADAIAAFLAETS